MGAARRAATVPGLVLAACLACPTPVAATSENAGRPAVAEAEAIAVGLPALHTELLATYPAADTVHRAEIREVRLRFSTPVQPPLSTISVIGPAGPVPQVGQLEAVEGTGEHELRLSLLAPLATGDYAVEWRTAGPDNHPITGRFAFRVERPEPVEAEAPPAEDQLPDPVLTEVAPAEPPSLRADPAGVAVRGLFFLTILGMVGAAVFRLGVVVPLSRDPLHEGVAEASVDRVRLLGWGVVGLLALSVPTRLWKQSSDLFGEAALQPGSLWLVLRSGWGGAWFLYLAMAALFAWGLHLVGRRSGADRSGWLAMLAAGVGAAFVPPLSGHAAAAPAPVLAILNDAAHVFAASVWLGTLSVLVLAGFGAVKAARKMVPVPHGGAPEEGEPEPDEGDLGGDAPSVLPPLARLVNAFSRLALPAVVVLVLTGLVNAGLQMGSVVQLVTTPYGRVLAVKLALAGAAFAMGFYNWRVVRPALARESQARLIRIPASVEAALGVGIVLLTALLVSIPPPGR